MNHFFLFGFNKSGTTFLQQLVDSHPQINCPPEHHFNSVINAIRSFCPQYKSIIESFDQRTGQQGIRFDDSLVMLHAFRGFVEAFMLCGADSEATHAGVNDNSMGLNLEFVAKAFPKSKFVAILRDPREIAVSLFHHKQRTEPEFRKKNGTLSNVADAVGTAWMKHMTKLREFESNPAFRGRLFIARFENLIDERATTEIRAILSHIGSTADATTVEHLLSQNNFQRKQRQQPQGNGFYRSGKQDSWSTELNQADVRSIEKAAGHLMAYYGYLPTRP